MLGMRNCYYFCILLSLIHKKSKLYINLEINLYFYRGDYLWHTLK